ncbi:MAG: ribonuclease III [Thermodesulfobacteriota bacterium]|nr:ribonuclease III [Thermodesulfobacteriota bacterium]
MEEIDLSEVEQKLQYKFSNPKLLEEALRHSSYVNEQQNAGMRDNECLEFLGDAVLSLVAGHTLMLRYPELKEGDLSRMRANIVNDSQLAVIARNLNLGKYMQLGKGEIHTKGREKSSILANALEAVIAAVYLDGGFDAAFHTIENNFSTLLNSIDASNANHDYKSKLQEIVQVSKKMVPYYAVINASGPDHDKTFTVQLSVKELQTEGVGKSIKLAEQDAAKKALKILNPDA